MDEAALGENASGDGERPGAAEPLPGLPVETGAVRVDESGFRRQTRGGDDLTLTPWDEVTCVTASGARVTVEGPREKGGPAHVLFSFRAQPQTCKRIEAAWRERVLRSLERSEPLEGTIRASAAWIPRILLVLSLFAAASAVADGWVVGITSTDLVEDDPFGPASRPGLAALRRAVRVVACTFLVLAAACSAGLLVFAIRFGRLLRDWRKWRLDGDGLTCWPSGERELLRPLAGDIFTPRSARMNERHVPLHWMSASPLVVPILLAWGRRAQAGVHRDSLAETCLPPAMAVGFLLLAVAVYPIAPGRPQLALATGALGLVLGIVWAVLFVTAGRKRRALLEEGERSLERLGW